MYANLFSRESRVKKIPAKAIILCHFASIALFLPLQILQVNLLFVDVFYRDPLVCKLSIVFKIPIVYLTVIMAA
jgi:hypothetical protein